MGPGQASFIETVSSPRRQYPWRQVWHLVLVLLSDDSSAPGTCSGETVEFNRWEIGDDRMTPVFPSKFLNRRNFTY